MKFYVKCDSGGGILGPYNKFEDASRVCNPDYAYVCSDDDSPEPDCTLANLAISTQGLLHEFSLEELLELRLFADRCIDNVKRREDELKSKAEPMDLLPDWGCFINIPEFVTQDLNDCGINLIVAIREEQPPYETSKCMKKLRDLQVKYNKHGADDTEGRSAVWELVKNACVGTCFDPKKFWDKYYV